MAAATVLSGASHKHTPANPVTGKIQISAPYRRQLANRPEATENPKVAVLLP